MAVKWLAAGSYFSLESFRHSGFAGVKNDNLPIQSLPPQDDQFIGTFVEIEGSALDEIFFNNWRWGFKFKNGFQSDFDADCILKRTKFLFDGVCKVEIHSDFWDGQEHCLCGLKFLNSKNKSVLEVGEFRKKFMLVDIAENERIIGLQSYKHPRRPGAHVNF